MQILGGHNGIVDNGDALGEETREIRAVVAEWKRLEWWRLGAGWVDEAMEG